MGRSSSRRDAAEISGTSMKRSTVARWKSVALSGVWTSVMVVSGGRTTGRLESFPLTMTRCAVGVVMSGRLSRHVEVCSGCDGISDGLCSATGLSDNDIERRDGEVAARRYLSDEQEVVARPSAWGECATRGSIDQALARIVTVNETRRGQVGNQCWALDEVRGLAQSGDHAVNAKVGENAVKSSFAGVHATVHHQASIGLHLTQLAPAAQRNPDPISEPFRPQRLTKQDPLRLGQQGECGVQCVVGGAEGVVAGDVGRIGQRIGPVSGVGDIREDVGSGESETSEFAIQQRKHGLRGELMPNRVRDDSVFGEMFWRMAFLGGLHLNSGQGAASGEHVDARRAVVQRACDVDGGETAAQNRDGTLITEPGPQATEG